MNNAVLSGCLEVCGPRYSVLEYGPAYAVDSTLVPEVPQLNEWAEGHGVN